MPADSINTTTIVLAKYDMLATQYIVYGWKLSVSLLILYNWFMFLWMSLTWPSKQYLGVVKKHILELRHMGIRSRVSIYSLLTTIHRVSTKTISRNFIFWWFGRHLREHFNKLEAADISEASLDKLTRGLDQSRAARMFYQVCGKCALCTLREISSNHSPHNNFFGILFLLIYANYEIWKGL